MKKCKCEGLTAPTSIPARIGAIPSAEKLSEKEAAFVKENVGKLVCYRCGGEREEVDGAAVDEIPDYALTARLRYLGVIDEPPTVKATLSSLLVDLEIALQSR